MKNKLMDLNDHLFLALERLNDDDMTPEQVEKEISRSKALTSVASAIINNASVMLGAAKLTTDYNISQSQLPAIMRIENK